MSDRNTCLRLSVENFFSLCDWEQQLNRHNWQFQDRSPTPKIVWQCLSVCQFFSLSNWQGQSLESHNHQQVDQYALPKRQVQEFFQLIPWESSPEIGSLPQEFLYPDLTVVASASIQTTFTDLSELF